MPPSGPFLGLGQSLVALAVVIMLGGGRTAGAQELAAVDASRGPRFLLASADRLVPLDVDRTASLARRLDLSFDGLPLKQALAEIARQARLRLAFSDDDFPLDRRVRMRAEAITVAAALTDLLLGTGVDVVLGKDGGVSLVKRNTIAAAQPGRLTGRVIDQQTNEGISGAEVLLEGTRWRTLTTEDGVYVLPEVDPGSYTITARRIGYSKRSESVAVRDGREEVVDFALQAAAARLGEVVATAQKRQERLLDVPQAVSVVSTDELAKRGILQVRDYANAVPELTFTTFGAGFTQVTLRGVTAGQDVSPTVGIYVDEVPYGGGSFSSFSALDVGLFDMERIEVLKGPQGTLYGASSIGGLLKYVTRRPDATRFGVEAQTGVAGTRGGGVSENGSAVVNLPIDSDKAALRASGFYSHDGGYIDNLALGETNVNNSGIYGGRADLLFTPTRALSIRVTGFLQDIARDGNTVADFTGDGVPLDGSLEQRRAFPETFDQRFRLVSGTVNYDIGRAGLTSISSYQTLRTKPINDLSAIYVPLLESIGRSYRAVGYFQGTSVDKFVQEVRLAAEGGRPFEWVLGGFYTHESSEGTDEFFLQDPAGQPAPNDVYSASYPRRFDEYAAFGDLTWHLTDRFNVTGGLRYAHNRQTSGQVTSGIFGISELTQRSDEDVVTYLANARYRFSAQATAYLRFATGYRPGGPNLVAYDPVTGLPLAPPTFESDRLDSYEVGFKSETEDQRFGIDLAAYYIDWDNIQVIGVRSGFGVIANAPGGASVRGVELAGTARPLRSLTITSALAYQDAHLSEADPDLGGAKGERLPNSPRFTPTLSVEYAFANERWQPTLGATLRYVSERRASFDASASLPQYRLPAYTTLDVRGGVSLGPVDAQLYIRNLLDERGQLSALTAYATPYVAILQPRTIGITATTRF